MRGRAAQRLHRLPPAWEPDLRQLGWRAQQRLHGRYRRLSAKRERPQALTAVARELCGYIWEIAQWVQAHPHASEVSPAS